MSRMRVAIVAVATASLFATPFALAAAVGGGGGKGSTPAVWIIPSQGALATNGTVLKYGATFSAGFSSAKASYPWAHAECSAVDPSTGAAAGSPFWGEWRALQADGTIGVFELVTADGTVWPSAGATCTLSLVNTTQKYTVLATTTFSVTP